MATGSITSGSAATISSFSPSGRWKCARESSGLKGLLTAAFGFVASAASKADEEPTSAMIRAAQSGRMAIASMFFEYLATRVAAAMLAARSAASGKLNLPPARIRGANFHRALGDFDVLDHHLVAFGNHRELHLAGRLALRLLAAAIIAPGRRRCSIAAALPGAAVGLFKHDQVLADHGHGRQGLRARDVAL